MKTARLTAPLLIGLGLAFPSGALAVGGPLAPLQGSYIGVPGSPYAYAAVTAGADTVVQRQQAGGATAGSELRVSGQYGVPAADASGALTGLSADGRTLVLAELPTNGPPRTTRLLVIATARLDVRARLTLPGWSTVDAISPEGRWLYLIHYPSSDVSRYEVLAYDLIARHLEPNPVVDPRDRGEAMTGFAMSRVMSAGGRWAYTLYFRPSDVPFIHALDTAHRRAVCIDLPSLAKLDYGSGSLALAPGAQTLQVRIDGVARASIDTRTFAVSNGGGQPGTAPARAHDEPAARPVILSIAALGLIAVAAALAALLRSKPFPPSARWRTGR